MIKRQLVLLTIFTIIISNFCIAQKLKYKDLYTSLRAKDYIEVEPLLKDFLSDPKQIDHPNANLQMANVYQEKSITNNSDIDAKVMNIDSAIYYYNKAMALINERDLKKNDKYYEVYYRRDLRTGKMGIKLSDIQLDIENKISDLNENKEEIVSSK